MAVCGRFFGKRLLSGTAPVSSIVSSARTGITAKLWQMRYEMQKFKNNATELQTKTVTKAPKDSFLKVDLPVASDPQVRDNYLNFRGGIRFGKLLEDIDAFAGNIAFMHCNDGDANTKVPVLVTACLDRLDLKSPVTLSLGSDLELQGQVNWTSKSSVQIGINLMVKGECDASGNPQEANLMTASMVFVHVQKGKAAPVNQIRPETESDRHLFAQGVAAEEMRRIDRANNLQLTAPTQEESEKLHHAMISGFGPAAVPLAATKMEAVELMQPQERNRAGKIFGGFLMHEAYELAYTTAASYAASSSMGGAAGAPTVIATDDISFSKPVSIGDVVCFTAHVAYTGSNELLLQASNSRTSSEKWESFGKSLPPSIASVFQVRVSTHILDLKTGKRAVANAFHFTFMSRDLVTPTEAAQKTPIKPCGVLPVEPKSYDEGIMWLCSRRRMLEALNVAKQIDGFVAQALFK